MSSSNKVIIFLAILYFSFNVCYLRNCAGLLNPIISFEKPAELDSPSAKADLELPLKSFENTAATAPNALTAAAATETRATATVESEASRLTPTSGMSQEAVTSKSNAIEAAIAKDDVLKDASNKIIEIPSEETIEEPEMVKLVHETDEEDASFGCANCWLTFDSNNELAEHALEKHGIQQNSAAISDTQIPSIGDNNTACQEVPETVIETISTAQESIENVAVKETDTAVVKETVDQPNISREVTGQAATADLARTAETSAAEPTPHDEYMSPNSNDLISL